MITSIETDHKAIIRTVVEDFLFCRATDSWDHFADHVHWTWYGSWVPQGKLVHTNKAEVLAFIGDNLENGRTEGIIDPLLQDGETVIATGRMRGLDTNDKPFACAWSDQYRFEGDRIVEVISHVVDILPEVY